MQRAALMPHPSTPCPAIRRLEIRAGWNGGARLALHYTLEGDLDFLQLPDSRSPRRADELWRHTCLEAFLSATEAPAYYEFNFASSTEWAVYRFDAYRRGMRPAGEIPPPELSVIREPDALRLAASIALDGETLFPQGAPLRLGVAAVIEAADGNRSYWALRHPPGEPDFHHRDGFALSLPREPAANGRHIVPSPSGRRWPEGPDEGERPPGAEAPFAGNGAGRSLPAVRTDR